MLAELEVLDLVDRAHAPGADLANDSIPRAGHVIPVLEFVHPAHGQKTPRLPKAAPSVGTFAPGPEDTTTSALDAEPRRAGNDFVTVSETPLVDRLTVDPNSVLAAEVVERDGAPGRSHDLEVFTGHVGVWEHEVRPRVPSDHPARGPRRKLELTGRANDSEASTRTCAGERKPSRSGPRGDRRRREARARAHGIGDGRLVVPLRRGANRLRAGVVDSSRRARELGRGLGHGASHRFDQLGAKCAEVRRPLPRIPTERARQEIRKACAEGGRTVTTIEAEDRLQERADSMDVRLGIHGSCGSEPVTRKRRDRTAEADAAIPANEDVLWLEMGDRSATPSAPQPRGPRGRPSEPRGR